MVTINACDLLVTGKKKICRYRKRHQKYMYHGFSPYLSYTSNITKIISDGKICSNIQDEEERTSLMKITMSGKIFNSNITRC